MLRIPLLCALLPVFGLGEPDASPALWLTRDFSAAPAERSLASQQQGKTAGGQNPAAETEDPIEQLRRELLTAGVEARKTREHAVGGLLLRKELRAHSILQDAMLRPEDPDHLVPYVLDQLEKKWAQLEDSVFGNDSSLRLELIESYASVIVRLLPIKGRDHRSAEQLAIEEGAIACLRDSIRPEERMQVFMYLLGDGSADKDIPLMSAAMFAAAGCRDMRLIPLIAHFLDDEELQLPAQLALQEKIIRPELFSGTREFNLWWEQNKGKTNIELIEDSARANLTKIEGIRKESSRELQALVLQVVDYAAMSGDWQELFQILSEPGNAQSLAPYLSRLRDALRKSPELGGDPAERIKLVNRLLDFSSGSENGIRALVLENLAYLVSAEDGEVQPKVVRELQKALFSDQPAESAAAFRGIQRFFSKENRRQVVMAASASQRTQDAAGLLGGLGCLSAAGWQPPAKNDQDSALWYALLQSVFADSKLDHTAKESAIDVARTAVNTAETADRVFGLLLSEVLGNQQQPARVRRYALDSLPPFLAEASREEDYLAAVSGLLGDGDAQMRRRAAEVLKARPFSGFPESTRKAWVPKIVVQAAARLSEETEEDVLEALVDLMVWMNDQPGGNNVAGRFRDLAAKLAKAGARAENAALRKVLATGLVLIGVTGESGPAQWVTAGEALLLLNDRPGLRRVLDKHQLNELKGSADDGWARRAFQFVIDAARKRPMNLAWSDAEAHEFELACSELERLGDLQGSGYDDQRTRLLRLTALASRGMHDLVVEKAVGYFADQGMAFDPAQEARVRMLMAEAFVAKGNGSGAEEQLEKLSGLDASATRVTRLWLDVASLYAAKKDWDPSLRIVKEHFESRTAPLFREAFLLRMQCQLGKQPGQADEILRELRSEAGLFGRETTPAELLARYQALLAAASKG